jgi:hypothetical protein
MRLSPTHAALLSSLLLTTTALAQQRQSNPSLEDAQADFNSQQYRPCLQKISRILGDRGNVDPNTRYDLLMLRGECMMQLRTPEIADDAFNAAAAVVRRDGPIDKLANAQAMVTLLKASKNLRYTSARDGQSTDIEILAPAGRKSAMTALLSDRLAALHGPIEKALLGTTLDPLTELVPALSDLYMVEQASTGNTARTADTLMAMGERARGLIQPELADLEKRVQQLSQLATDPAVIGPNGGVGIRGLHTPERDELQGIDDTLLKIQKLCQQTRQLSRRLGGKPETWDALLADCAEIRQAAQQTAERRY